jgi:hypothetical protein
MRGTLIGVMLIAVAVLTAVPALGQPTHETGLERAREVAARGVETARGLLNGPAADHATGLERAAEAIAAALERGNGEGHGWGRGQSAVVHELIANGVSPSDASHGQAVRAMVHAYNALRRQAP